MTAGASHAKSLIATSYDRAAADFAGYADKLVYRFLAEPLAARLRDVEGRVLDVAGGTGALARMFEESIATDIAPRQLVHNPVELKVAADAERLPFRSDSFGAAACAFGINHFPEAPTAVREMARVAPVVGLVTWARPDEPFAPKQIVLDAVERRAGRSRTEAGDLIEDMTNATGSTDAITALLAAANLEHHVEEVVVEVPWPGAEAFVDYRMSMTGVTAFVDDLSAARSEAITAINALPEGELRWSPRLIVGVGRR